MLRKLILSLAFAFTIAASHAHNPQLATFYIRNYDAVWMIEGSFAQAGLQTALLKYYNEVDFENLSPDEYKMLVAQYVKEHIDLKTEDGASITLGEGGVKLGSHQSDVRFVLENLPKKPENLSVKVSCLSENPNQQNILKIPALKAGEYIILSDKNGFVSEIIFVEKMETLATISIETKVLGFSITLLVIGFVIGIYYLVKKHNEFFKSPFHTIN